MTLDDHALATIDEIVRVWVDESRLFTAFEVSLETKKKGIDQRHRYMKEAIHQAVAKLGGDRYMRTLMDVGAPTTAWVYHQRGDNPYVYQPLERRGDPQPPVAARRPTRPRPDAVPQGAHVADKDGQLKVPIGNLAASIIGPDKQVTVSCDAMQAEIRVTSGTAGADDDDDFFSFFGGDAQCTVDDAGMLMIPQAMLENAAIGALEYYRIEVEAGILTVSKFAS